MDSRLWVTDGNVNATAQSGDTIKLAPGTYSGIVAKSLTFSDAVTITSLQTLSVVCFPQWLQACQERIGAFDVRLAEVLRGAFMPSSPCFRGAAPRCRPRPWAGTA